MASDYFRFPRSYRLTRGSELRAVIREGKRIRTEHLEFRASASLCHHCRIGFIVPKYRQDSVARNRLKRRLREAVRLELLQLLPAADVVIRARATAYQVSYKSLAAEIVSVAQQISVLV